MIIKLIFNKRFFVLLHIFITNIIFIMFSLNNLSTATATTFQSKIEATLQAFYLQPVNEEDIARFYEDAVNPAAEQAWQAGLCSNENEALEMVRAQTKEFLEKLKNKTFFEEWRSHNFLFHISLAEGQIPCGYIHYSTEGKEAFIEVIFLEKECRGKGIATNVLNGLEAELKIKGFDCIRLHVFTHNVAAINLYKKLGYEVEKINEIRSVNMIKILNK